MIDLKRLRHATGHIGVALVGLDSSSALSVNFAIPLPFLGVCVTDARLHSRRQPLA